MKVELWKTTRVKPGTVMISEQHELRLGGYNEFYLPSVTDRQELLVRITDDAGEETMLHLKR